MSKVQLLFSTKSDPVSFIIRFLTWSKFSHVDYIDQQNVIGATLLDGVRIKRMADVQAEASHWEIHEFECENAESFAEEIFETVGAGYDVTAIIGFLFRANWEVSKRWFCSELIFAKAKKVGVTLLKGKRHRFTPGHLLMSPLISLVESK